MRFDSLWFISIDCKRVQGFQNKLIRQTFFPSVSVFKSQYFSSQSKISTNKNNDSSLYNLYLQEYEENQSPESKFVKDLDRLDLVMQAFEYEKRDNCIKTHQEFFDSTDGKFNHPLVIDLVNEIKAQRELAAEKDEKSQTNHVSANSSW